MSGKAKKAVAVDPALFDVVLAPVVTEKSTMAVEQNKMTFKVRADAGKALIKHAVETIFDVNVVAVNTIKTKGKTKRFRGIQGKRSDVKKAIITLKEGDHIDLSAKV